MATRPHPHATFRVEKIIAISILEDNLKFYKVQWAPSWVADTNLNECEDLVAEFLNKKTLQCRVDSDANSVVQNQTEQTTKPGRCDPGAKESPLVDVKVELEDDEDALLSCPASTNAEIPAERFPKDLSIEAALIDESDEEEKPTVVNHESGCYDNAVNHHDDQDQQRSILVDDDADSLVSEDVEISGVTLNNDNYRNPNTKIKPGFGPASYSGFESCLARENRKSSQYTTAYGLGNSQQAHHYYDKVLSSDQNYTGVLMSEMNHSHNGKVADTESWSGNINAMPNNISNANISNSTYSDTSAVHRNSTDSQTTDNATSAPIPEFLKILTADANGMFTCPRCPRMFPLKHKLMRHYTCHTRPYTCDECNKSFGRKGNLKRHMIQHMGLVRPVPRVVKCSLCASSFANEEGYLGHFREHHEGDPWMHFQDVSGVQYDDTSGVVANGGCKDGDNLGGGSSFAM